MPAPLRNAVIAALGRSEERSEAADLVGGPGDTGGVEHGSVAASLARAGLHALGRVARAAPERGTATELLAADALLTYACEAAAEDGPEALDRLLSELGYARFASLLDTSLP